MTLPQFYKTVYSLIQKNNLNIYNTYFKCGALCCTSCGIYLNLSEENDDYINLRFTANPDGIFTERIQSIQNVFKTINDLIVKNNNKGLYRNYIIGRNCQNVIKIDYKCDCDCYFAKDYIEITFGKK